MLIASSTLIEDTWSSAIAKSSLTASVKIPKETISFTPNPPPVPAYHESTTPPDSPPTISTTPPAIRTPATSKNTRLGPPFPVAKKHHAYVPRDEPAPKDIVRDISKRNIVPAPWQTDWRVGISKPTLTLPPAVVDPPDECLLVMFDPPEYLFPTKL
ncbi:hypothetical protein PGT21_008483 [Puccinia graminis f. sp. tritici]|uniref:Uncharacterized protein n=1 Tax=Puccinia graminis f. sp. tritici TaxID=56615 RepID=A0A5B0MMD9_PUCGR|nr:hypothetical protein PGT21_008483 [Puccinia graminis f. sp. tritici]KAA1102928.1 hypothetical protein PGTUg99_037390 [Puccinia graminis f. sp. tritici]